MNLWNPIPRYNHMKMQTSKPFVHIEVGFETNLKYRIVMFDEVLFCFGSRSWNKFKLMARTKVNGSFQIPSLVMNKGDGFQTLSIGA
jgi:hypothetical protein